MKPSLPVATAPRARKPAWLADDLEFLPAAVEIIETPASPIGSALLLVICALAAAALLWAYLGRVDVIATAQGKIEPNGSVKVIEPLITGRVQEIAVQNGQEVKAGDLLLRLNSTSARADLQTATDALASYRAEVLRRAAALRAAQEHATAPAVMWTDEIPQALREREGRVLAGDTAQLAAAVSSLEGQIAQKRAEVDRLTATIKVQQDLVAVEDERANMRQDLVASGSGARATVLDALESLRLQQAVLATDVGQLAEAKAGIDVLQREIAKTLGTFVAENSQKMADAERQADDYAQRVVKAETETKLAELRSPVDGTVQGLTVTTLGQVVASGAELMRVVPKDTALLIQSYVSNGDIGFVKEGQNAAVKVDAFPFGRYGTIDAEVTHVGRDAVPWQSAQALQSDPNAQERPPQFVSAGQVQNLVFPITLAPVRTTINADGTDVLLSPGMTVTVEIKTGSRRIIEFLFSPLVELASNSFGER